MCHSPQGDETAIGVRPQASVAMCHSPQGDETAIGVCPQASVAMCNHMS